MADNETKKVKLLKEWTDAESAVHAEGEELELSVEAAGALVEEGIAEEVA